MTQENKLKKIVEKAGFHVPEHSSKKAKEIIKEQDYYAFLFDCDFAKAIWGDKEIQIVYDNTILERKIKDDDLVGEDDSIYFTFRRVSSYLWHLQQAVISDNPIDYYYENLPK